MNRGIISFLKAKRMPYEAINKFLEKEGINKKQGESYIEKNFPKFASFCDREIKAGNIKGKPIRLNYSYKEYKERYMLIKNEYSTLKLTLEEEKLLSRIRKEGPGFMQSVIMKSGQNPVSKDYSYTSKTLQWLPLIQQYLSCCD